jgi:hypothetical protein
MGMVVVVDQQNLHMDDSQLPTHQGLEVLNTGTLMTSHSWSRATGTETDKSHTQMESEWVAFRMLSSVKDLRQMLGYTFHFS